MNKVALIVIYNHQYNENIPIVESVVSTNFSIEDNLLSAYKELNKLNIVESSEILTLECWLSELKKMHNIN